MSEQKMGVGFRYEPSYEAELLILFGLLMPYLEDKFIIVRCNSGFPDCTALRNGVEVGIEFELSASNFFDHKHDESENINQCHLIICWEDDIRYNNKIKNGRKYISLDNHEIEILALKEVVEELRKRGQIFILDGKSPDLEESNEERFFAQLEKEVGQEKYKLIRKLYEEFKGNDELEIRWSKGKSWYTMNFVVKNWDVIIVGVQADGLIWVGYTGNPAVRPYELPQETQVELKRIFNHKKNARWPTVPLKNQEDLEKICEAIKIAIAHSQYLNLIWHNKQ